jgi:hypothetical protein
LLERLVLLNLIQFVSILTLLLLFLANKSPHGQEPTPSRSLMEQRLQMFPDPAKSYRLRQRWNEAVQVAIDAAPDEQDLWQ